MVFLSFFIIVILIYIFLGIIKNNNKTIEIQKDIQGKEEKNEKRREMSEYNHDELIHSLTSFENFMEIIDEIRIENS